MARYLATPENTSAIGIGAKPDKCQIWCDGPLGMCERVWRNIVLRMDTCKAIE